MIKVSAVTKKFGEFEALSSIDINVGKGTIYGLVGTNGSGKTTVIKHITGILLADSGEITIEGQSVYNNETVKAKIGFIADDLFFFGSYNLTEMSRFMKNMYPKWNQERFECMVTQFNLSKKGKISRFSKGMQKQAAFILSMSTMPEYLILDEPIDGLDPIIRKLVWKYVIEDVSAREMTVLVSSHNLREMEGICDYIGILSKGKMVMERELDELKSDIHKVQVAYKEAVDNPYEGLNILHRERRGTVELLVIKDPKQKVEAVISQSDPVIFDMLPLSLEEIFIYELGGVDNEIEGILF